VAGHSAKLACRWLLLCPPPSNTKSSNCISVTFLITKLLPYSKPGAPSFPLYSRVPSNRNHSRSAARWKTTQILKRVDLVHRSNFQRNGEHAAHANWRIDGIKCFGTGSTITCGILSLSQRSLNEDGGSCQFHKFISKSEVIWGMEWQRDHNIKSRNKNPLRESDLLNMDWDILNDRASEKVNRARWGVSSFLLQFIMTSI
jgi:hypothetical protein